MTMQNLTDRIEWPPKPAKHVPGTPRKSKAQRATEQVEALRAQVEDPNLPDWARRSSLKYLVRCARSHQELLLVAKGYREQTWANHSAHTTGDNLAWIDILAAFRAIDLGWDLEKWIRIWAPTMASPSAPWLAGCHGDFSAFSGKFHEWISTPSPESFPPTSKYCGRDIPDLPWVNFGGSQARKEVSVAALPPSTPPERKPVAPTGRPVLRLLQGGRSAG